MLGQTQIENLGTFKHFLYLILCSVIPIIFISRAIDTKKFVRSSKYLFKDAILMCNKPKEVFSIKILIIEFIIDLQKLTRVVTDKEVRETENFLIKFNQ